MSKIIKYKAYILNKCNKCWDKLKTISQDIYI